MRIIQVPISSVVPWAKNPRGILEGDFARLKKQIQKLGVYKPLVAFRRNGKYVVLGGNMRLKALGALGYKRVDLSLVDAGTEAKRIEYALSDNDRAGYYEEDRLAELILPHVLEIDLEDFKVDLGTPMDLKAIVDGIGPDLRDDEKDFDELETKNECPKCGYKW